MRKTNEEAFTLIELLVVVAIIGILASIASLSFNEYRRQARNARRISDIKTLITAFHAGASENELPGFVNIYTCVSASCYGDWSGYPANSAVDAFLAPSLPQKPSDPPQGTKTAGGYLFVISNYPASWFGPNPGPYLLYTLEPPSSCGPGRFSHLDPSVVCVFKLDYLT